MKMRLFALNLTLFVLAGPSIAVDFTEVARFNIDSTSFDPMNPEPQDVGVNASAVAWNGSRLYVAGFNNSGGLQDTAIVEVLNATSTGLIDTPSFSNAFGNLITPASRGFSGLDLSPDGTRLAAAWDDGQSAPEGLRVFDTNNNTLSWSKNIRGGSGVAFDPGFPGGNPAQGTGVAWVRSFDSGRRSLQNATTGADIWTPTDGMIWHPLTAGLSFLTRDIDFDPSTGDMYARTANEVIFARRNGDNGIGDKGILADEIDGLPINNQHLAFMGGISDNGSTLDLVVYNDRNTAAVGQDFFAVNKLVSSDGFTQALDFTFLDGSTPGTGAGWYDYDFDPATGTLAVLDPSNRNVHIFDVGDSMPTCAGTGDFDCSGSVAAGDLDLVLMGWGQPGDPPPAGWVNDLPVGSIGADELDRVLMNWGNTVNVSVPEPNGLVACAVVFLCIGPLRRRGVAAS